MTDLTPTQFTVKVLPDPTTLSVRVSGELDYDTSDDFVHVVTGHLSGQERLRDLRLDFRELTLIDSTGLSALLMIHRRTSAAGVTLHLDNRPERLDRILRLTDVLEHLTAPAPRAGDPGLADDGDVTEAGAT
ncbi:STAS domain-containing protein [Streptomyces sp. NPDC005573]|uniref:STAS domain-containing protein n=1 Tax=unclassified Streptomyces TaxID=2593676 RepID=UPI0033BCBFA0